MGFLRVASIIMLANCYSPDARNWRTPDASVDAPADAVVDATVDAPIDASITIDAALPVEMHVQVSGGGEVAFGSQTCRTDCTYSVPYATPITLEAIADPKQRFDRWTTVACAGEPAVCTFVATQPVTVGAHFVKGED